MHPTKRLLLLVHVIIMVTNVQSETFETAEVPEIDIGLFVYGSNEIKLQISQQFDKAFNEWGAVRLINHSIPLQLKSNFYQGIIQFFNQNLTYKLKYEFGSKPPNPGYNPSGKEKTKIYKNNMNKDDDDTNVNVESFSIFSDWHNMTKIAIQSGNVYIPKYSQLPSDLKYFVPEYWMDYRELAQSVHSLASMALGFEENNNIFEQNMTENCIMQLRINHYPKITSSQSGIRFGAHQDFTGFTFIQSDPNSTSGLQIYGNDKWYNVEPKYDSILVIAGEFIERWTNNHWIAALHRVIYNEENYNKTRTFIIVLTSPNMNVDIDVLPCAQCTKYERKYEVINGIEFLKKRLAAFSYDSYSSQSDKEYEYSIVDILFTNDKNKPLKTEL